MALIVSIFIVEFLNVVVCFGRQDISDDAIMASPKAHFHGAACVQPNASHLDSRAAFGYDAMVSQAEIAGTV